MPRCWREKNDLANVLQSPHRSLHRLFRSLPNQAEITLERSALETVDRFAASAIGFWISAFNCIGFRYFSCCISLYLKNYRCTDHSDSLHPQCSSRRCSIAVLPRSSYDRLPVNVKLWNCKNKLPVSSGENEMYYSIQRIRFLWITFKRS